MADDKRYKYSEIFHSFQGEGEKTGTSCAWIRFFLCNLQCDGFGQKDPTDPSTYILPYQDLDVSQYKRIEDLPVFEYGCDSSYTWAKKFRHLAHNETADEICNSIEDVLRHSTNPYGRFLHPGTLQRHHMCFTGGEPMLNQEAIYEIMREFHLRENLPHYVTVETNGTRTINHEPLKIFLTNFANNIEDGEWFWSVTKVRC